jgi:membrane protease YdiL (CAAX protease family)
MIFGRRQLLEGGTVALTAVFTWVFNNTKGSVLLSILAHGSVNMAAASLYDLFPAPVVTGSATNFVIGFGTVTLVIVALTRGCLGYRQEDLGSASAPA